MVTAVNDADDESRESAFYERGSRRGIVGRGAAILI